MVSVCDRVIPADNDNLPWPRLLGGAGSAASCVAGIFSKYFRALHLGAFYQQRDYAVESSPIGL